MYLYKEWYVEKGTYRLKLTHIAIDSTGKTVETVVSYSTNVTYQFKNSFQISCRFLGCF